MMTIPSFQPFMQGQGVSREVRGMSPSPPGGTATTLQGLICPSPSLIAATALTYLAAGRSVVPIAPGRKAPSVVDPRTGRRVLIQWEQYQEEPATPAEVRGWFAGPQPMGLGIVAGPVSGLTLADGTQVALEFLDVDDPEIHARFVELMAACGARSLLERLPCEATPAGGRHYGYCCVEWAASTTLARRGVGRTPDGRAKMVTLIESRGQGGQCVVAPTPPGIHPDHPARGYAMVRGDWTHVPLITPEARRLLWACARALDEAFPPHVDHPTPARRRVRLSPLPPNIPQEGEQEEHMLFLLPCSEKHGQGRRGLASALSASGYCTRVCKGARRAHGAGGTRFLVPPPGARGGPPLGQPALGPQDRRPAVP
jgi:Bifunctional DNA primase/polymerase, N-terminal